MLDFPYPGAWGTLASCIGLRLNWGTSNWSLLCCRRHWGGTVLAVLLILQVLSEFMGMWAPPALSPLSAFWAWEEVSGPTETAGSLQVTLPCAQTSPLLWKHLP